MFKTLGEQLERESRRPDIFFRDDDADRDIPELRRLLDVFGSKRTPISLAVIPGTLSPDGARLLRDLAEAPWVELHQHGWMHTNHEPEGRKCEFGPSRGLAQQRLDIMRGRERLLDQLGDRCVPIFTPPWNRCTSETCRALVELGFTALSKDQSPCPAAVDIPEASIAVDIFTWKRGPQLKSAEGIGAELLKRFRRSEPVGILLHHKVMAGQAFALVESLLATLAPVARFHSLEAACRLCN